MPIGSNAARTRAYNRLVVLETLRLHGPQSRPDIARRASLTAQTVANIAEGLLREGLLSEHDGKPSGRGAPPRLLSLNPRGGCTVGVEIARGELRSVLVDLGGTVLATRASRLAEPTPARALPQLRRDVTALLRQPGGRRRRAPLGIGVVMPGPFDASRPRSLGPTELPGWSGIDVAGEVEAALGVPVLVGNDATAAAVGEVLHGSARGLRDVCLLHIGAGLGLGIVQDGRPVGGARGNAGEIGHVVAVPGGRRCFCGRAGCLERYLSLDSLGEALGRSAGGHGPGIDAQAVEKLLDRNDTRLAGWVGEAAALLGWAVDMLASLLDPQAIVIGGPAPARLIERLMLALPAFPAGAPRPKLLCTATGAITPALGAACLPLQAATMARL
jgi:predicted NBD/HSP70 family sugar kinase